jgi:Ca2+-binding EF-hand superfamily protein
MISRSRTMGLDNDVEFKNLDVSPLIKNYMIREAFNMFDENESGDIDRKEFKKLILTLGLEINDKKIYELMREIDKDGSGTIDIEEFAKMMNKYQFSKDSPIGEHLESTFNLYDKDGDGYISSKDIQKVGEELDGIAFGGEEADLLISLCKHFSKSKDIKQNDNPNISKEEFINMLLCVNFLEELKKEDIVNTNTQRNESGSAIMVHGDRRTTNLSNNTSQKGSVSMSQKQNSSYK